MVIRNDSIVFRKKKKKEKRKREKERKERRSKNEVLNEKKKIYCNILFLLSYSSLLIVFVRENFYNRFATHLDFESAVNFLF